ncbi:exopolysaccharide production protein [Galbitalea sp. SE-J8]|uniref:O-antigen ligase family protein n=1 Tax=Galbitalea sp. SE-J8 TaxID=3054952 RepID=UPI00259D0A46|nr:exopolysaccharide production protein [Galbitalea sp. SE-J8]MDM4762724.1 exopolysaccharide production protein [Galbitalea sp. SE-J8]
MTLARRVLDGLGSAPIVRALTLTVFGIGALAFPIHELFGWPALIAALATLVVLCAGSLAGRQRALDWDGILPISLLAFLGWCTASVLWSGYQWATLSSSLYQLAFAALGIYVALMRDMIQIVRALGDVLRWVLSASLVLEVVVGILLDTRLRLLNVRGVLEDGGPIQGLAGDSAHLGILALLAAVTFGVELLTRSVPLPLSVASLAGSIVVILLTQSTVVLAAGLVVVVAALVLTGVRHAPDAAKLPITWTVIVLAILGSGIAVLLRARLLDLFAGSGQVANRRWLWEQVIALTTADHAVVGWGWMGHWRTGLFPFSLFYQVRGNDFASAFNTLLDVFFQVGLVGLVAFVGLLGLVLARSWVLAVRQRSVVYLWPALTVVALIATSITESAVLVEFSWLMLVVCVVTSADKLSWRRAFERLRPRTTGPELPRA